MSKIRINNFGPIKSGHIAEDGFLNIEKVTLFVGNQGSGKSTVAKLISTFSWMEKALVRGDHDIKWFQRQGRFRKAFLTYHRIENYLKKDSEIVYVGEAYLFTFAEGKLTINEILNPKYELPQIMYVPAERNFISYLQSFGEIKLSSASLREFRDEYKKATQSIKGTYELPINNTVLEYDRQNDILHIKGSDYKLRISEASSGFQSLVPLYLVSSFLAKTVKDNEGQEMKEDDRMRFRRMMADIIDNLKLNDEQRRDAMSAITDKFVKTAFINIVEEPEQNLFPTSQWDILGSLLKLNNESTGNKLVMTTHSPYIINYLTHFVKAHMIGQMPRCRDEFKKQLDELVPAGAWVNPTDLVIYELDEKLGTISKLETYKGLPSDENYLNNGLANSNDKFSKLLDLEQLCR